MKKEVSSAKEAAETAPVVEKAAAKKPAARKPAAKPTAAAAEKKTPAKKPAAKKPAARKTAAKKASGPKKPTALIIMDGFGHRDEKSGNAIEAANTPNLDKIFAENPMTYIGASGLDVGLPDGQMGNSEVGHTNIGAGRIVYQELTRITKAIQDGDFFENEALLRRNGQLQEEQHRPASDRPVSPTAACTPTITICTRLLELAKTQRPDQGLCPLLYGRPRRAAAFRQGICRRTARRR